ncbi:hypothetical protein MWU52_07895 [Jannaschia sp. S6380]|nr:hypothetical protein [Jannaschia sp. S6380]MCK0167465.1 hypothetical protein [Jannaschia sp. S6380]
MTDTTHLDAMAIEARARALRAAYMRDMVRGIFARLRRTPAGTAHA